MPRKLHIGGQVRSAGWEILDTNPGPHVDHAGDAGNLKRFADATFSEVYASHVLEHFDHAGGVAAALKEWHRVLEPGGRIFISVPDLEILAELFLAKSRLTFDERFLVMRMIFGAHIDKHDYHLVGLNEEFLTAFLAGAGFAGIRKVQALGLFDDTSAMTFKGVPISLNMIAEKRAGPGPSGDPAPKTGRNQPCPCGSGRKFKHCHGKIA